MAKAEAQKTSEYAVAAFTGDGLEHVSSRTYVRSGNRKIAVTP
jgi:hypothetical protein